MPSTKAVADAYTPQGFPVFEEKQTWVIEVENHKRLPILIQEVDSQTITFFIYQNGQFGDPVTWYRADATVRFMPLTKDESEKLLQNIPIVQALLRDFLVGLKQI